MDMFMRALRENPELAVFLTLAVGFAIGKIRIGSFRLGNVVGTLLAGVLIVQDSEGHLLNYPLVGYMAIGFTLIAMTLSYRITTEGDKKSSAPALEAH